MYYTLNLETSRIELTNLSKEEYQSLDVDMKKKITSNFLFSKYAGCWVSRGTKNHYSAIKVCNKLGFTECKESGNVLSYEEQLNIKAAKAENRIDRYNKYADNAEVKCEQLQKGFNEHRGDISFMTQPNINSSGGRSFTNYRNRILNNYEKSFDEYRKSEYFKNKANIAQTTAKMEQLNNKVYLENRIDENKALLNKLNRQLEAGLNINERLLEETIDKLSFFSNKLEVLGIEYSKYNVKKDDIVKLRNRFMKVVKANTKTFEADTGHGFNIKYKYSEIQDIKRA
jgi:hypothetical protein